MIYTLVTPDPNNTVLFHWKKVPFVADQKRIDFKPGLNVVFGPNGSGKSTLITTLAIVMHCHQGNLQRVTKHSVSTHIMGTKFTNGRDNATVQYTEHDGEEVRYAGAHKDIGAHPESRDFDDDFGLTQVGEMMSQRNLSSGQNSYAKITQMVRAAPRPSTVEVADELKHVNSTWEPCVKRAIELLKGEPREGVTPCRTLLLDEPDRSMDFEAQIEVWNFLRAAARSVQVIVATHSPMALGLPDAHYIETAPGCLEKLTLAFREAGWHRLSVPEVKPLPGQKTESAGAKDGKRRGRSSS